MAAGLGTLVQQDFSAGMVRSVAPHLIPDNGFYDGSNLLLNTDGSPYKRGGTTYKSNAAFGSAGLRFLWDGFLAGGQRTVFASDTKIGVLAADDTTPVDVGGTGLSGPVRPAVLSGVMYLPGGQAYAGSRHSASYSTGTVAVTNQSKTVTGTGTTWTANLDAGSLIRVAAAGPLYGVASVDSNTQITLATEYQGATATGQAYSAAATVTNPGRVANVYAAGAGRLATGEANRIYFSKIRDPSSFAATDYHELPGGVNIIGMEVIQNNLLAFTTQGIWMVSNFAYDLTDAQGNTQQALRKINGDLVCWGNEGIASYHNALIVPTVDGVWLVDTVSAPQPLGASINLLIQAYVQAGNKPGLATVHNNHYFLPIIDGSNGLVDLLVCRLDRPTRSAIGTVFPWTHWNGFGATVTALANRISTGTHQPVLLGASSATGSRVLQYQPLVPDSPVATDADGSVPAWKLITKDYPTTGRQKAFSKKVRVRYEMLTASGGTATMQLAAGSDARPVSGAWGSFNWGTGLWTNSGELGLTMVPGDAPVDVGSTPFVWPLNLRARYVRLRLSGTTAATRMILRTIEVFVRAPGRQ